MGIVIGVLAPGELNTITDVAGVRVGHRSIIAGDQSVASFSVQSYAQLQRLVEEVAGLGYALTVLDDGAREFDFVFRETDARVPPVLAALHQDGGVQR